MQAREALQERFANVLCVNRNRCFIDITVDGIDKGVGLQELLRLQHWEDIPLLTIGDDENDLPMIERFNGYAVQSATPAIQQKHLKSMILLGNDWVNKLTDRINCLNQRGCPIKIFLLVGQPF